MNDDELDFRDNYSAFSVKLSMESLSGDTTARWMNYLPS